MNRRILNLFAAVTLLALSAPAAHATLLTFDSVPAGGAGCWSSPDSVVESGFTISNCPGYFIEPGEIHLNDGGSGFSSFVDFSYDTAFDAVSIMIENLGISWFIDYNAGVSIPYDNVVFSGYRDGVLVASQSYSSFALGILGTATVLFDSDFLGLDMLRVAQVLPSAAERQQHPGAFCFEPPCGQVSLMEGTLMPVPVPAALPLFAGAFGVLGFAVRRRRA